MKLKKGDNVQITLGKDRGKSGAIDQVLMAKGKVVISGLNLYKRHVKKQGQIDGGIIELPKPVNISNVALVCPSCKKVTRVGYKLDNKEKLRICKKCGKEIIYVKAKG